MKLKITEAENLSIKILKSLGFTKEEAKLATENMIEGELTGKKTHGLIRLKVLKQKVKEGKIKVGGKDISIEKETPVSLLINGQRKTGLFVVNKALELGIKKCKKSGMAAVGCTNTAPISGMIGQYARKATEYDLIYIGFNNSPGGLVPYGSIKEMFGTNPLTVGIPTKYIPIILDMASSKITWGHLLIAKAAGKKIPDNVAIDAKGNITTDPEKAMEGGLLPIAEHKGSGLAFIVEILGGALTDSRVGNYVEGGWGSFFVLIDPNIFRSIKSFKRDIEIAIKELKSSPKSKGVKEIYYPGEKSQRLRKACLVKGAFEMDGKLWKELQSLFKDKGL